MRSVIDLECDLPPAPDGTPRAYAADTSPLGPSTPNRLPALPGYGFDNYGTIFRNQDIFGAGSEAATATATPIISLDEHVAALAEAGIEWGIVQAESNAATAEVVRQHPDRFIGMASIHPFDGMRGVRELERLVREEGLGGLAVMALYEALPASDRRFYPLYAKCVELDIPVRIYAAMTYANDRPYDLGHPRHIDRVAVDFPELRIVAGLSGWPWVNEMVALLRRHPNLYCDTAAHRPRHFATPGSGWEQFLQFGNTLIQDKVMVGLSASLLGDTNENLIDEYLALPLKDAVKEKWLYGNASRFFGLG